MMPTTRLLAGLALTMPALIFAQANEQQIEPAQKQLDAYTHPNQSRP